MGCFSPVTSPVLIVANGGRALAQAALRAGIASKVCDSFQDSDLDRLTLGGCLLPESGGDARALAAALDTLDPERRLAVVYGAGFDGRIGRLESSLSGRVLYANKAAAADGVRDPRRFFATLDALSLPFPSVSWQAPLRPEGWLYKDSGAGGGLGVRCAGEIEELRDGERARALHYYQKRRRGDAVSLTFLAAKGEVMPAGYGRLWNAPCLRFPMRFGGAVSASLPPEDRRVLTDAARALSSAFSLRGLNSLDALVGEDGVEILELNPRPGLTLDLHDHDATRPLFGLHCLSCLGAPLPAAALKLNPRPRALAVVYARHGLRFPAAFAWPCWCRDRPRPGSVLTRDAPVCTLYADAAGGGDPLPLLRRRLDFLHETLQGFAS